MAWGRNPWYNPKKGTKIVVPVQTGTNSVRYEARSVMEDEPGTIGFKSNNRNLTKRERKQRQNRGWYGTDEDEYGYVDSDFGTVYNPKPRHQWTPTKWSSFSFNTFSVYDSDNDDNLFVKAPENYVTPTRQAIESKTSYWHAEDIALVKELARVCYFKMIDERDYISEKYEDPENYPPGVSKWRDKKELMDGIYDTFVPGFTPLEQAIALAFKYRDKIATINKEKDTGKHTSRQVRFNRRDYADFDINDQMEMNTFNKHHKLRILNNLSIVGNLGGQFKVEKETGEKEVANSPFLRRKIMREYDQLRMVQHYQRILPNFRTKFLTKDLVIDVPVSTSESKQKIIILLDYSGSMNEEKKQIWVNTILVDRLKYVLKGEAEVYFSYFINNPSSLHFIHIKNEKDVKRFWHNFSNNPGGSLTDMGRIVEYIDNQIKQGKLHNLDIDLSVERPEILFIQDGQDRVGYDSFPYKVNAISLMQLSTELKGLCIKSGGKQVFIDTDASVTAYSRGNEDGEEIKSDD